jgi:hypothetical protein
MTQEYERLVAAGYERIVCHRDVAPDFTHGELAKLEMNLPKYVKTKPIKVCFVLSVMEVEAWFLAEHTHFQRLDRTITVEAISAAMGFDPSQDDMQLRPNPTDDLNGCYAIGGKIYSKFGSQTTDAIDYVATYCELAARFPHLQRLCQEIESFLGPMPSAA